MEFRPDDRGSDIYRNIEQWCVLLRAEDVRISGASARAESVDRELDGAGRAVFNEFGDPTLVNAVKRRNALSRERLAPSHPVIDITVSEDDVERDLVDAGILAANGFREV